MRSGRGRPRLWSSTSEAVPFVWVVFDFFCGVFCVVYPCRRRGAGPVAAEAVVSMLAFDLETTGLDPATDQITCAAVCDPDAGIERVFFFLRGDDPEEFMGLLDNAERLCAFNGASFDLPFIAARLGPTPARVGSWRLKLHDVYVACKWGIGVTFPLQALLDLNGIPGKTGQGKDAIKLFHAGDWDALGLYCLNDTRRTHQVSSLASIILPKTRSLLLDPRGIFRGLGGAVPV